MRLHGDDAGAAVLYTALLLPTFLLLLAFVVELGALRVARARLVAAADLAATMAVGEQDVAALAADGHYHLAPSAVSVARDMLARELAPLAAGFAAATPDAIAAAADVVALEAGVADPRTGRTYAAPTVRIAFEAPLRTPLFVLAALREATTLRIVASASAR
ncbi:MAG: hypothetical protein AUH85_08500 [Chloroflexi bacterium 13_1_40CM_4_68_4]|nr:MAG: hypothetical protein AUH85_08500 [Chloroflexi bacterium 13_1_40CM_4_68_4]